MKTVATLLCVFMAGAARAQTSHPPAIASISVCSATGAGGQGSCPIGTADTHQIVLAPDGSGKAINSYTGMIGISDEHQSVFAPGALGGNTDYLFFVATRVEGGAPSTGVSVLSAGAGPGKNGQWTMDFATGYGAYPSGPGTLFVAPTGGNCPAVADGNAAHQDQTFDLKYAAPGSVVPDPSGAAGSLLMIYEGTNTCLGNPGGPDTGNFYSSVGIATSRDYGRTWPTYRGKSGFTFVPLPGANSSQGPQAPMGALGSAVCIANDCTSTPPAGYGRYPVLTPSISLSTAAATGKPLPSSMGDSEMSGFLDDASGTAQYVYIVYDYKPGTGALADPKAPANGVMLARAKLNGGAAPLSFFKWNGQAFAGAGLGGYDGTIIPAGSFANCGAPSQIQFGASISYVETTQQYLLTFLCDSPGDPANGQVAGAARGAAWFYSTSYDLSDPTQWSAPREIGGSWGTIDTSNGCSYYKGFYPTLMSLGSKPGHLTNSGYVFYLWGCQTEPTPPPGRQYSSRIFTITLAQPAPQISSGGVVIHAGVSAAVSPGSLVDIYGANLAAAPVSAPVGSTLPTSLGGVEVMVNGASAPLIYVSPTLIVFQLPYEAAVGTAQLTVTSNGAVSAPAPVTVQQAAPSILTYGNNRAVVLNQDYSVNGPANPAEVGSTAMAYLIGGGPLDNPIATGATASTTLLSRETLPVTVTVGSATAVVPFAGMAPGFAGLVQVNFTVPNLPANDYPLQVKIGSAASNQPTLAVSQ
jgi:uncharacterized protein (TIGR03437 family)